jgi:small-conductance mechanosensitive channel
MEILSFLATMLWAAMLLGFIVAVFWLIVTVVFIRGYVRWLRDNLIKQIEEEEDRPAVLRSASQYSERKQKIVANA